jgi:ribonuclease HI
MKPIPRRHIQRLHYIFTTMADRYYIDTQTITMGDRLSTQTIRCSSSAPTSILRAIAPDVADANRIFLQDPVIKPSDLYSAQRNRFVRLTNPSEMLMFVNGSSLNNGSRNARAGYGIVFAPPEKDSPIFSRLEQDGHPQTSNRAELRAVLISLSLRFWLEEGFSRIVLACNSEHVVKGISEWIFNWRNNGWKTAVRKPVTNQDLWKELEEKLREMEKSGMLVQFWKIPREWNEADKYGKAGAVIIHFLFIFRF